MRSLPVLLVILAACGDNNAATKKPDAAQHPQIDAAEHDDAKVFMDAKVFEDAPPTVADGIQEVRAATDGAVDLNVTNVVVTYLRPIAIGSDPAGFYVQSVQTGPAIFVAVDPATLAPVPVAGDTVSFHVTAKATVSTQPRATTIDNFTRSAQGADLSALVQNLSTATDLVSSVTNYDGELVTVTGTLVGAFTSGGSGFQKVELDTAGVTGNANLVLRYPLSLNATLDPIAGCTVTATKVTLNQFGSSTPTTAEVQAFNGSELHLACNESVVSAVATSTTTVQITLARNVDAASVMANGSQFTADNGLTLSAPIVSNNLITLTTSAQTAGTTYTVTVANTVTDIDGDQVMAPGTATFTGFVVPATVRINEVNANIANGCDLIELRVISGGSMAGFKITERNGGTGELNYTFPASFSVQTNDFVVVHLNSASTMCNPGTATTETVTKTDQPAATFAGNYDTAWDFWNADTGLTNTDNVITLFAPTTAITDAVLLNDDPAATPTASATETAAAAVLLANQWSPSTSMVGAYVDAVFRVNSVDDLNAVGTTAAGTSTQRVNDADTNAKADWTTGAGVASTWGALNAGQTAF
ncbi:MAG: hypothetical protein ABI678_03135 [Kofleriaceae bacterium]